MEGYHSAAWINEPQRRPHWDFRSPGLGTLWIMLTFCRQCSCLLPSACRKWGPEDQARAKAKGPGQQQHHRMCAPPVCVSFGADWWQKLNYDSKWTAAGGAVEAQAGELVSWWAGPGNAEPPAHRLIMKYMNFLDNNRRSLAGIIMGAAWWQRE